MNNSLMASAPFVALPQNDSFSIMTNVTFTCVKGHELNGTNSTAVTSRCMNFELWLPDITQILCSKVSCGSVPVVTNAQIIPNETNTTLYGDTVRYQETNTTLYGDTVRYQETNTTLYGDTVRYRCTNIAYNFNGTMEVWNMTCNEMKRWQPPAPACQPIKCYDTPVVTNAVSNGSASFYTYSTVVTFTCQEGCFFPSDNSTVKSTQCNLNGSWSYVEPMCERFFCAVNPPPIAQSTIIKTTDSTHAVYKCDEGTEFSDLMKEKETSCNNVTLLWTQVLDVCRRLSGAETNIWLSLTNTSFVESPFKGCYSYTLIECSVLCMNTPGCSIINYSDNKSNPLNCKLYTGKVNSLTPLHSSNWNVYLVGQMLLN
ncbi:sushi, von Willebrand factor type A, EGF and pentraxin domain-containing protein 1-like [Physella acuta]|uniref:sushi, von Willebrand factor type A, EGF and pentraxin domain-containing protein 1-like n=1 Tax=Physella acuta TaxID=109671 RepID=UPI0027DCF17F|nr:sushi, von Willebrand factor type A, EGF and pentraxin domain-containing protein 1-like [Physella acuta]